MDVWSASMIDTRIVYGFPGAGKTHYISDCIANDYFYKYGTTLILCFEQGQETYDSDALRERNSYVTYFEDYKNLTDFCVDQIRKYHPDRIYAEMNTKLPSLRSSFPEMMNVTSAVTWFNWSALELHFVNDRQMINQMVTESQQITFRGCPSKELLAPYSQEFQLMNHRASYLRQDPMGYHERAFDLFVPYSLDDETITIGAKEYLPFWLDAAEHPEHYEGKRLCFPDPLELRQEDEDSSWSCGRVVMTCCMADLQFMSFALTAAETETVQGGWITMEAIGRTARDAYGRNVLKLEPKQLNPAAAPKRDMILQTRPPVGPSQNLSMTLFQRISTS